MLLFIVFLFLIPLVDATAICLSFTNSSLALGANYSSLTPPNNGLVVQGNTLLGCTTQLTNKLDVSGGTAMGSYACTYTAPTNGLIVSGNVGAGCTAPVNDFDSYGGIAVGAGYACNITAPTDGAIIKGQVGIGTSSPNAALALDVSSTTQAFAPPRMTTAQVNAISSPPNGAEVYDSTLNVFKGRHNSNWIPFLAGGYQVYADIKPQGTAGGTNTAGAWHNRTLTGALTGDLDGTFTSLDNTTNRFTIQPGTYWIRIEAPAAATNGHLATLFSVTANADVVRGSTEIVPTATGTVTKSIVVARLVLTSATTYVVRHYTAANGAAGSGFGYALNLAGYQEVYTTVSITKIA